MYPNRTIAQIAASALPAMLAAAFTTPTACAQEPTPGFNNKIPTEAFSDKTWRPGEIELAR